MKVELDVPQELMESIKNQIAEYEKENQKPKDVIDYENGWVIDRVQCSKEPCITHGYSASSNYINYCNSIGLYRDTKEEAEKLLRKMQIEHRLRQWAKMCKEKVDLNNRSQEKHYLCKSAVTGKIEISSGFAFIFNDVYFTDKSILQHSIKDIGEQNLIDNYFVEV